MSFFSRIPHSFHQIHCSPETVQAGGNIWTSSSGPGLLCLRGLSTAVNVLQERKPSNFVCRCFHVAEELPLGSRFVKGDLEREVGSGCKGVTTPQQMHVHRRSNLLSCVVQWICCCWWDSNMTMTIVCGPNLLSHISRAKTCWSEDHAYVMVCWFQWRWWWWDGQMR